MPKRNLRSVIGVANGTSPRPRRPSGPARGSVLGDGNGELGAGEYLKEVYGLVRGVPPEIDLAAERALQQFLGAAAEAQLIRSAHDCSDGGLAVTLAECCFRGERGEEIGVDVSLEGVRVASRDALNDAAALFGESASRVVITATSERAAEVLSQARTAGVPARVIGRTGGTAIRIAVSGRTAIDLPVAEARRAWSDAIERYFRKKVA